MACQPPPIAGLSLVKITDLVNAHRRKVAAPDDTKQLQAAPPTETSSTMSRLVLDESSKLLTSKPPTPKQTATDGIDSQIGEIELLRKHADNDGFIPIRVKLTPSRAIALSHPRVKRYYAGEFLSDVVRIRVDHEPKGEK